MKIFNSLTRQLEEFEPMNPPNVGVYCCGPTVYSFVTIGNWRTNFLGDLLVRTLKYFGYKVTYVMNITDVGHLTGDNLGDANTGEDKLEKAARKEEKTVWDIANFYQEDFLRNYELLGLSKPQIFCRATENIKEQIELIKLIEDKGMTYKISDGVYFDSQKYENEGNKYGELSNIDEIKEGTRVEANPEKKDPRDFALWKFSYPNGRDFDSIKDDIGKRRAMEWESPWGLGFPGWHIECSAMSRKYLGDQFDVHIGGEDLRSTHHPNEIAQSECATGRKPFVKYWMHGAFLLVDGGRMGKSLGNAYTLTDLIAKSYKPEHLRYFYLSGNYRQALNFTWDNLENARRSYVNLLNKFVEFKKVFIEEYSKSQSQFSRGKSGVLRHDKLDLNSVSSLSRNEDINCDEKLIDLSDEADKYEMKFVETIGNDLDTVRVLALVWDMVKSSLKPGEKYLLLKRWDKIFGLGLDGFQYSVSSIQYEGKKSGIKIVSNVELSDEVVFLVDEREMARKDKDWGKADEIRQLLMTNYELLIKDRSGKVIITKL